MMWVRGILPRPRSAGAMICGTGGTRLLYRSEVYALGQNLYRYFMAQSRGLHHTEIDLRAGREAGSPAGRDRLQDVAGLPDQVPALFRPTAGEAHQGLPGPWHRAGFYHPADPLWAGRRSGYRRESGGRQAGGGPERRAHVPGRGPLQRGDPAGGPESMGSS